MFEELPDPDSLAEADDATVVAAIEGWGRAKTIAARRHAAVAELISRRCAGNEDDERSHWACDQWDAAAAEIGAALNLSPRRASTQMYLAQSLRERPPRRGVVLARPHQRPPGRRDLVAHASGHRRPGYEFDRCGRRPHR